MSDILAVDVGTTEFKLGIFGDDLQVKNQASRRYSIDLYDNIKASIDPEKWWDALLQCCEEVKEDLTSVGVISLSVTTPGLIPMDKNGEALGPAILFLDGRSNKQAKEIRYKIGVDTLLKETCNLPVSGGSSLCSILWIKENEPKVWKKTYKFGHCNTYMVQKLTGSWVIDPSTTSITCMYNTALDNLEWNEPILSFLGVPTSKLPALLRSHHKAGNLLPDIASRLGLPDNVEVLVGGNDAILASWSNELVAPGDMYNIHGTCDIVSVITDHPIRSENFNVRCHVVPNRWATFFVLNSGGKALDWFHDVFCSEMTLDHFYKYYVPTVLNNFFHNPDIDQIDKELPVYTPFLQGSRYSTELLSAGFIGLTLNTNRDSLLLGLVKGNLSYQANHIKELQRILNINPKVRITGGAAKINGFLQAKKRWMGDFHYEYKEQSSLIGAAKLGQLFLHEKKLKTT